ncbi:MAG: hypothetical protein J5616_05130 [Bacteroidaceae bacterium]|nr:hypothetical protein [Bacteroidaceae bacterium]
MKKIFMGVVIAVAGLMCACQQQNQQSSKTQGAKFDAYWNTGDSLSDMKRLHKWEAYVEEHPQDEIGWRNLHHAMLMSTFFNREPENYNQREEEFMKRVKEAIPDTYTYYLLAMETCHEYNKIKKYAEEALKRLPKTMYEADYKTLCRYFLREDKDEKRLKDMLTRYYKSGTLSPDVLYFHYNELQGMEQGGIYLGQAEDDLIPKKMIQLVLGMHKDKVLVNRSGDWYKIWRACKVPEPTENWAETTPMDDISVYWHTQTLKILAWIGEHSEHPVYYSASNLREWLREKLSKDLLKNLYNEGLLLRYSAEPYDNIAVTCRNIEERYSLDYLYLPFTPSKDSEKYFSDATGCTNQTIVLLQGILPYYQQYDPQRCHWLSGVLLKAIERRRSKDYSENCLKELRQYYEATKSAAQ